MDMLVHMCIFMVACFNQACASLWPAHTWFLKIYRVWIVGMRMCVSTPEAINNKWRDVV